MLIAVTFTFSGCKKDKGNVEILDIFYTVENCSLPFTVDYEADFSVGSGDISFSWDFGDGSAASTEKEPVHIYQKTGLYQVTVTITNREVSKMKSINVDLQSESLPIIPEFTYSSNSSVLWAPSEIFFTNTSRHATTFWWDFGDGDFSSKTSPSHIFDDAGSYTVRMYAICNGDTSMFSDNLKIESAPSKIEIETITVWLPDSYTNADLYCKVFFDGFKEGETSTAVGSFPVSWNLREDLFFFHGDFNSDVLLFEVWEETAPEPAYIFDIPMSQISYDYFPDKLTWNSGSGFSAEVYLNYSN